MSSYVEVVGSAVWGRPCRLCAKHVYLMIKLLLFAKSVMYLGDCSFRSFLDVSSRCQSWRCNFRISFLAYRKIALELRRIFLQLGNVY